jgi:hypothetical protein
MVGNTDNSGFLMKAVLIDRYGLRTAAAHLEYVRLEGNVI